MNRREELQTRSVEEGLGVLKNLPDAPECAELRRLRGKLAERDTTVKSLRQAQYMAAKARSMPGGRSDQARRALRAEHLLPIARRARPLFRHDAKMQQALILPPTRATLAEHAAAALTMAKALRPHAKFCHAEGFRPGFLAELTKLGTELRSRTTLTAAARRELSAVTTKLKEEIRAARELAGIIDVEVAALAHRLATRRYEIGFGQGPLGNFSVLAKLWARAYKLGRTIGRPRKRRSRRAASAPAA